MRPSVLVGVLAALCVLILQSAASAAPAPAGDLLLVPEKVWSGQGDIAQSGLVVLVHDGVIAAVGPEASLTVTAGTRRIALPGATLTPGLIDLHSHLFLHPYNEVVWNDQVLKEPQDYRTVLATNHARDTLLAGFTSLRDLGTEGAGYADVSVKRAIDEGLIPGPHLFVATRAIVASSSYGPGPKGFRPDLDLPQGAQPVTGVDEAVRAVREQASRGADWIKFYADYRVGPKGETMPTLSAAEMKAIVDAAHQLGRPVSAHAGSDAGVRMAVEAGVDTIEHGDAATEATMKMLKQHGAVYVPTLTAVAAIGEYFEQYRPGGEPTARMRESEHAFRTALKLGVTIANGSDVGVFKHGENWRELEWMVKLGMRPAQALHAATDGAAKVLRQQDRIGRIAVGMRADLAAFEGDPSATISALAKPVLVVKDGRVYRAPAEPR
ncbi:MAG: amidohydrolase family protein [Dokdonella sp.]|uniref:metal-dependent hydrolase family protein n=1 Tax=Dokdonella sp. TaxID=2291710 RepID=UPI0025C57284|nr:amidohydrolase family protein [Dokdonella sp.]MBZ0222574.1 amidohydrolase family protein [Dokdonella sp.]